MITVVNTPAVVSTVSYRSLVTVTVQVVQPDGSTASPIVITNFSSSVPKINIISNLDYTA